MIARGKIHENDISARPARIKTLFLEAANTQDERLLALIADAVGHKGTISVTAGANGEERQFQFGDC